MKRILTVLLILAVATTAFASGSQESDMSKDGGSVTLIQNKPEIDPQLQAYGALWAEKTGNEAIMKSVGGSSSITLGQQLRADYAAGEMPDIFIIAGIEDYKEWESLILDMSGEAWAKETSVAFKVDGKTVGCPVAVEGWGMAYNKDMLDKAGIDPASLTNYAAYKAAFEKLDGMKAELGVDSVVSMAAGPEMGWVTAHHNFNSLLSNGMAYGDQSAAQTLLDGKVDAKRLGEYADWVELLFMYADTAVLTTGNYDSQVGAFANSKAVFLHQGNWTDPNMAQANATFKMGFAPHGSMAADTDGIFVSAPSYYVINKESKNVETAKQFLNDLVFTAEGQNFMVNEAGMIPAFANVSLNPKGQLSKSVQEWSAKGKVYSWNQYLFSGDFRDQTLAPIYNQFANGAVDKAQFVELMTAAFQNR
ncbi:MULTISPECIES: ABC transporter substrate-binding protein [unclassified Oceanispirochaeta]|uniref:ABC transporter substrate-binding protein n=1 Tax=unclassified Oceanispirochaeta TaxID=2635722 RepID=UPI000E0951D4|nr:MULTISPECIES: ABC transporter substrate-binding protein [unclassified Oceanispirochaeta]MBF9018986.1 carbohydrate ABC transporter substrate-binding protein [Oceanispirochaeta sp. M2]NPD75486.1 carbohydrate ABC transporter substrate-binding protein [Oceanispirochaeta sp. M1]RDG28664.1 carbohydrate ABC transporter substrate-binding protein [Oceanispirochaeta sp. M1]